MQYFAVFLATLIAALPASAIPVASADVSRGPLDARDKNEFHVALGSKADAPSNDNEKRDIGPDADAGQIYLYTRDGVTRAEESGHDHGHTSDAVMERANNDPEPDIGLQYQMYTKREANNPDPDIGLQYQMYTKRETTNNPEPDIGLQYQMYAKRETETVEPDIGLQYQMYSKRETDNVDPDIGLQYQMYSKRT